MNKPYYKNWMPKGMILSFASAAILVAVVIIGIWNGVKQAATIPTASTRRARLPRLSFSLSSPR